MEFDESILIRQHHSVSLARRNVMHKLTFSLADVTGSSDGSIRVWEWSVGQPVYTARVAGQHAKVIPVDSHYSVILSHLFC